jgi:hypothetical protein
MCAMTRPGHAVAEHVEGTVYLALSLRNVGAGIGVLQGWFARAGLRIGLGEPHHWTHKLRNSSGV